MKSGLEMAFSSYLPSLPLRLATWAVFLVGPLLIGCGHVSNEQKRTGAKQCVQNYFQAIVDEDWSKAYSALDESSQRRWNATQFAELARKYRRDLGFDPKQVFIRACEEQGAEATAHVVLTGLSTAKDGRSKDALVLRRSETGWRVVLPTTYGRARRN
jgi:hypothetical protein